MSDCTGKICPHRKFFRVFLAQHFANVHISASRNAGSLLGGSSWIFRTVVFIKKTLIRGVIHGYPGLLWLFTGIHWDPETFRGGQQLPLTTWTMWCCWPVQETSRNWDRYGWKAPMKNGEQVWTSVKIMAWSLTRAAGERHGRYSGAGQVAESTTCGTLRQIRGRWHHAVLGSICL